MSGRGGGARPACLLFMTALLPDGAMAQVPETETSSVVDEGVRRLRRRLAVGEHWEAGTVRTQLDRDRTLIPYGKGAIFVPAMRSGLDEPALEVLEGATQVAEGRAGERILLPPGSYTVRIGSGAASQRLSIQARVEELSTTVIPVSWSGLTVHVVDERYASQRESYEVIRVDDREYIGVGFGTDEQQGEPVSTWILKPGLYKIVRAGENYRARRDFLTVRLRRGRHTHFILVVDEETGEFGGGGEVPPEELFRPQSGAYSSLIAGGDITLRYRDNAAGLEDGWVVTGQAFVDGRFSVQLLDNPLILQLQIEEGVTSAPDRPIQKTNDRVDLDLLYLYRLEPWIGPYAQAGVESNIFPGEEAFRPSTRVRLLNPDGSVTDRGVRTDFALAPPLGLTNVREGVGLNVRAFKTLFAEVNWRAGFGARHAITRDFYERVERAEEKDDAGNPVAYFRQIRGNDRFGVETTLLATARLTRYVLFNAEVDALFTAPIEDSRIEAEASLALKITSFLSLRNALRYVRDATLTADPDRPERVELDVLVRFSFDVL